MKALQRKISILLSTILLIQHCNLSSALSEENLITIAKNKLIEHINKANTQAVDTIIEKYKDRQDTILNFKDSNGKTPISLALELYTEENEETEESKQRALVFFNIAQKLISISTNNNLQFKDNEGDTPLHLAVSYALPKIVSQILDKENIQSLLITEDKDDDTPLISALKLYANEDDKNEQTKYLTIIDQLIEKSTQETLKKTDTNLHTPLHLTALYALEKQSNEIIKKNLNLLNNKDNFGIVPIYNAIIVYSFRKLRNKSTQETLNTINLFKNTYKTNNLTLPNTQFKPIFFKTIMPNLLPENFNFTPKYTPLSLAKELGLDEVVKLFESTPTQPIDSKAIQNFAEALNTIAQ